MKAIHHYTSIRICISPFLRLLGQDKVLDLITTQFKLLKLVFVSWMEIGRI